MKLAEFFDYDRENAPYWLTMGILIWVLLTLILIGQLTNAAETVRTNEIAVGGAAMDDPLTYGYGNNAARGADNIIRHAYKTSDNDVNLSYSSNNGSSWSEVEVLSGSYSGLTDSIVFGVVVSSNNTTCVLVATVDAEHKYDLYLITLWAFNLAWSWEIIPIHYSASYAWTSCDIAINATDVVLMVGNYNSGQHYKTFRLNDRCLLPALATAPTNWNAANYPISCVAKSDGKFWMLWQTWDGSNYRQYMRDFCQTVSAVYKAVTTNAAYMGGTVALIDGTICAAWSGYVSTTYWIYFLYLLDGYTTIVQRSVYSGTGMTITHQCVGLSQSADMHVTITYYDDTNDKVKCYHGLYSMDYIQWSNSGYTIYTSPGASDAARMHSGLTSLYPSVLGTRVGIPKTGFMTDWCWKDEKGANDDYYKQLCYDSTNITWPYISWSPMGINNYSSEDALPAYFYLHDFNVSGGNPDYSWAIVWVSAHTDGWFCVDENGTIYGYSPTDEGEYQLTIHVWDFYRIHATHSFYFNVTEAEEGVTPAPIAPEEDDIWQWEWSPPDLDLMSNLWVMFFVCVVFVSLATAYRRYVQRYEGWKFAQKRWTNKRAPLWRGASKPKASTPRPKYRQGYYK